MFMPTLCVVLPAADRAQLRTIVANGNTPQKLAVRAQIMLMLADRVRPSHVATRLGLSRNHVHYWVRRYVARGVPGVMRDAWRPGRRKRITSDQIAAIVNATLTTTPPGRTHWSTRTMARAHGVSEATIRNIWHQHGLQPHRVTRFKLSKDPQSCPDQSCDRPPVGGSCFRRLHPAQTCEKTHGCAVVNRNAGPVDGPIRPERLEGFPQQGGADGLEVVPHKVRERFEFVPLWGAARLLPLHDAPGVVPHVRGEGGSSVASVSRTMVSRSSAPRS
jgi:transposase